MVAIRSVNRTGNQGRVAAALATSVKWGEQLAWCSTAQPVRKLGYPGFEAFDACDGRGHIESLGQASRVWGRF